ncbi:leucyl/phenylalanyl-tRNA--protein transferase [Solicola gregarius]|uniref:Leucyl/phenylalanyl-tRNA--protein transferase n=1 Tax=Solicola gregarius TaxID=2908642 RepID=A0AA46TM20_9ACTN|nr:leucyl/phenylalanyl-tRNA--protein transferase [Solicola gregarius]UYM07550.1 leucyl/phenylalanyl-tRNA--protein transferase [Solicola gregarius]
MPPVFDLPPSRWTFDSATWPAEDCVAAGADLEPQTILNAYSRGAFPMPVEEIEPMLWWSPVTRGVLRVSDAHVSRSLRRSLNRFEITVDRSFGEVIDACGDPQRPGAWISESIRDAYVRLHDLGWAHSIEARTHDGVLAGGVYGIAIGGLFAGESMFHHVRDASKVALMGLVSLLDDEHAGERLIDVQWQTPHLSSLGVTEMPRNAYLEALPTVCSVPLPRAFATS